MGAGDKLFRWKMRRGQCVPNPRTENKIRGFMTRTGFILTGPDFINAPSLLLDKHVWLLSTPATRKLTSHRLMISITAAANPRYVVYY